MSSIIVPTRSAPEHTQDISLLHEAFQQFTDASQRLQERYELLQRETEELRAALRRKEEEIRQAERLSMLGETAAAMAHEVRNPLGAIRLFISLLERDCSDRPPALEILKQMNASVRALDNLVSNILHFSRDSALPLSPLNVHQLVHAKVDELRGSVGAKARFVLNLEGSPFILGHEQTLGQALYNLLINALQATGHRGVITVTSRSTVRDTFELVVHDNGPGVPNEVLQRAFEPFVSTRNEGTGLGLAIVRQIIEKHGGVVSVANDGGARFTITVPQRQGRLG